MSTEEQWLALPGYEGLYEISNHGRVKTLARAINAPGWGAMDKRQAPEKILKTRHKNGVTSVNVSINARKATINIEKTVKSVFGE